MTLFVILICLGLQHFLATGSYDQFSIFQTYSQIGQRFLAQLRIENGLAAVLLLLVPALIIVAGINYALYQVWFNSLDFLFNIAVLYYCLSACNMRKQLQDYFQAQGQNNQQSAFYYGVAFLKDETPKDPVMLIRSITQRIFIRADRYIFSVLFWYILFGVTGAVIYALTDYLANQASATETATPSPIPQAAALIRDVFDWLPVRLSGLAYALVGHFAYAIEIWRKRLWTRLSTSSGLAAEIGLAALELDKKDVALAEVAENRRALDLVEKAIVLWVVVIAICTLFSWVA